MWLEKFFDIISRLFPKDFMVGDIAALSTLDPSRIYVENVRSIFGVSDRFAVELLETAVRQGVLQRLVEVACPDGAVAASAETEGQLPESVNCWMDRDGFMEPVEYATKDLQKTVFYRMIDGEPARPNASAA